jgi:lysozyme
MRISERGLRFVALQEGFSAHPYRMLTGAWAIGYGHTYGVSENTPSVSEDEARDLLRQDIEGSYGPAVDALALPLSQNQFDATCSLVYQLGVGVLRQSSTFGSHLHAGDWESAADAMLLYCEHDHAVVPELEQRRTLQRALFLAPDPPAPSPLDVLTRTEREVVQRVSSALSGSSNGGSASDDDAEQLAVLRQLVWVAAVRGRDPDGSAVPTGWDVDLREQRYAVLARLSGWGTGAAQ